VACGVGGPVRIVRPALPSLFGHIWNVNDDKEKERRMVAKRSNMEET